MIYYICLIAFALCIGIYFILRFATKHSSKAGIWGLRGLAIGIIAIFFVRFFSSGGSIFTSIFDLTIDKYYPEFENSTVAAFTLVAVWLEFMTVGFVVLYPFFNKQPLFRNYAKTVGLVSSILNIVMLKETSYSFSLSYDVNLTNIMMPIEVGLVFFMCILPYFENKDSYRISKHEGLDMLAMAFIVIVVSLPPYFFGTCWGQVSTSGTTGFGFYHRVYLYFMIAVFVILFLLLRGRNREFNRMIFIYVIMSVLVTMFYDYDFNSFTYPALWPLSLSVLTLILVLICLVVRCKWLFNFSFFIGAFAAFMSLFFPDFSKGAAFFDAYVVSWWFTRIFAFVVPMLMAIVGIYERPRFKQYLVSLGIYVIYFVVIDFLGAYLVNWSSSVDYFYTQSDYIISVLGTWGNNLKYDYVWSFMIGTREVNIYPVFQVLYMLAFAVGTLVLWFIYVWIFSVVRQYRVLEERNHKMRVEEYALKQEYHEGRLSEIMNEETKDKLVVKNFYKKYGHSKVYAVEDASFTVEAGKIIGFLGHNGAGKSTIIKCIVGMQPATSGEIQVNGYDVFKQPVQAKQQIGFVPDHYALYEKLSGRDYINYVADLYEVPKDERDATLKELTHNLSMEESIDSPIATYSHGMKQKIAIMSALIHNPKLWILDEPLTGLDPTSVYEVKECMKAHAAKGNIVFFSSHLIDVAEKLCDEIIIIKEGHILIHENLDKIQKEHKDLEKFYLDMMNTPIKRSNAKEEVPTVEAESYFFKTKEKKHKKGEEATAE